MLKAMFQTNSWRPHSATIQLHLGPQAAVQSVIKEAMGKQYLFSKPSPALLRVLKLKGLSKQGVERLQVAVVSA